MERILERTDILDMMGSLKLFGMRSAFDEIVTTAIKRQHELQRLLSRDFRQRLSIGCNRFLKTRRPASFSLCAPQLICIDDGYGVVLYRPPTTAYPQALR